MDLQEAILFRHSYRGTFKPDPVARKDLERIAAAGAAAPSGCNTELTQFVIVDDPAVLQQIAALLDKPYVATAPAMILVVSDPTPAYKGMSFELQDSAACTQNIWLALTALGYASVWLDGYLRNGTDKKIAAVLGVPDPLTVRVLFPIGKPAGDLVPPRKKPVHERVHLNHW